MFVQDVLSRLVHEQYYSALYLVTSAVKIDYYGLNLYLKIPKVIDRNS